MCGEKLSVEYMKIQLYLKLVSKQIESELPKFNTWRFTFHHADTELWFETIGFSLTHCLEKHFFPIFATLSLTLWHECKTMHSCLRIKCCSLGRKQTNKIASKDLHDYKRTKLLLDEWSCVVVKIAPCDERRIASSSLNCSQEQTFDECEE